MLKIMILVCAAGLPPQECTDKSAISVIRAAPASSAAMCGFQAQAQMAETSLVRENTYMKIVCKRQKPLDTTATLD